MFRLELPAQSINLYKNSRTKIMKCCVNIHFIKQCLYKKLIPKYANLNISNTSPASLITAKEVQVIHLKDEIDNVLPIWNWSDYSFYIISNFWLSTSSNNIYNTLRQQYCNNFTSIFKCKLFGIPKCALYLMYLRYGSTISLMMTPSSRNMSLYA
jgi:hypothetical protein